MAGFLIIPLEYNSFCNTSASLVLGEKNPDDLKGGILCIENVQKLLPSGAANDINKLDKLFSCMDKWNNDPIVILSGLSSAFKEFLVSNPDVRNRFEYYFDLKDFSM